MLRPKDVADQLGISSPTLRLWSNNFFEVLSPAAQKATTESGTAAQRRYSDADMAVFKRAKEHLNHGKTYEETLAALQAEGPPVIPSPGLSIDGSENPPAGSPPAGSEHGMVLVTETHPVIRAFEEALKAKDEALASKDETIATKDQLIAALQSQLEQASSQKSILPAPTRFRWGLLNRLLLDSQTHVDGSG